MHSNGKYLLFALTVIGLTAGLVDRSYAIPAFSREHNTECATCHTVFPALNEYGDAFMKNGFVWTKHANEAPAVPNGKNGTSAPESKNGNGDAVTSTPKKSEPLWLAGLPQTVPISVEAALTASYNDDDPNKKVDFSTRALSLLAGGTFRDKLGFFLKYNLYAEGTYDPAVSNTPVNMESPYAQDLEEFYLVWRNIFNTPINIKAGRLRPQLSLWQKSNKVGISDFATTAFKVGNSNFSADSPEDAVEANAVLFNRLFVAAGIVDRNDQESNEGYGHISVKVGGSDFKAHEPDLDLDQDNFLDYVYAVFGVYGYSGRNSDNAASNQRNNFLRSGAEMDLVIKNARLKLAYAREDDSNADYSSHIDTHTDVWLTQADYMFTPDIMAYGRYEKINADNGSRISRYIPGLVVAPIQNTKVTLEYQHITSDHTPSGPANQDSNLFLLGIRVAF